MKRALILAVLPLLGAQDDEPKDPAEIYAGKLQNIYKELGTKHAGNGSFCDSKKQHAWGYAEFQKSMAFAPDNAQTRKRLGFKKSGDQWVVDPDYKVKTVNEVDSDDAFEIGIQLNKRLLDMGKAISAKYEDAARFADKNNMADQAAECWRLALEYDPTNKDARKHFGFIFDKDANEWRTEKYTALFKECREAVGKAPKGAESSEQTFVEGKTGVAVKKRATDHFSLESSTYDQARLETLAQHAEAAYAVYHKLMNLGDQSVLGSNKPSMVYYKVKAEHERFVDAFVSDSRSREEFKKSPGLHAGDLHETTNTDGGEGGVNDYTIHSAGHSLAGHHGFSGGRAWIQEGMSYVLTFMILGSADNHCGAIGETSVKGQKKNFKEGAKWRANIRDMVMEMGDADINAVMKATMADLSGDKTVKAWSILDFMIHDHSDRFLEFVDRMRKDQDDTGEKAIKEVFGWSLQDLDDRWRAYVRSTY